MAGLQLHAGSAATPQQQENMKVLITNDDGYFAEGIKALADHISKSHEVFIVAPQFEQSGISQAITFLRPLNPNPVVDADGQLKGYSVNGAPVDCVKLGIHELCPWKPDLIVSGINCGLNIGINVCHSGTVGGAFAAAMFDFPSAAISIEASNPNFDLAAEIGWSLIERTDWTKMPARSVLNINVPAAVTSSDYKLRSCRSKRILWGIIFKKVPIPNSARSTGRRTPRRPSRLLFEPIP